MSHQTKPNNMRQKITRKTQFLNLRCVCLLLSLLLMLSAQSVLGQQVIKGTIKDANGNPVAGASISVRGSNMGVTSDENGYYSLTLKDKNTPIVISSVGFKTQEFVPGN